MHETQNYIRRAGNADGEFRGETERNLFSPQPDHPPYNNASLDLRQSDTK